MKKSTVMYLCAALFAALALSAAACGKKEENPPSTEESTQEESSEESTSEQSTVEESSAADEDQGAEGEEVESWSEEMTALREAVVSELGSDYWPSMAIPADYLEGSYGLSADMYEDYMGEMPMMSVQVDTLLIVKAKEGQAEAVEEALTAYRESLVSNTMQYPSNLGKIQASKVERIGSYVCFVLLGGDTTAVEEQGEEAVITHCQEQNDRVIEIVAANVEQ